MIAPLLALLVQTGPAEGSTSNEGPNMWIPMLVIGMIFWFLVFNPGRKERKQRKALLGSLSKGDEVLTRSGIYGRIVEVKENVVTLQIDDKTRLRVALWAVHGLVDEEAAAKRLEDAGVGGKQPAVMQEQRS